MHDSFWEGLLLRATVYWVFGIVCLGFFHYWWLLLAWVVFGVACVIAACWDNRDDIAEDIKEWWPATVESMAEWSADRLDDAGEWAQECSRDIQGWLKTRP